MAYLIKKQAKSAGAALSLGLMALTLMAASFPDFPVREPRDYSVSVEKNGVLIGVQLLEDSKEQKKYFGSELADKGFLPAFLVIQNTSGDSVLFDKSGVTLGEEESPLTGSPKATLNKPMFIIGGLWGNQALSSASVVQQNMLKKEIQSKTLSSGNSVHGFVYIPVPKKITRTKIVLRIPIKRSGSDETAVLEVSF